jgi:chromosome segregation ATPase
MAVDVGAIIVKLKPAEDALKKYETASKELDNKMKRLMAEFQLVNQGLWQGKDHIAELEKELAEAKATFNKMSTNKIGPIKKELSDLGQTAGNTAAMTKTLEAQAKTLHAELDKATGDASKKSVAYAQLKKIQTEADRVFAKLNDMKQEIAGLPKTPTL